MFTNKLSKPFLVVVVTTLALVTVSFVVAPKASQPYQDYALRHKGEVITPIIGKLDTSSTDYFQRHPELTVSAILGLGASDYFQRHPELTAPAETSMDMTDYYFRQAVLFPTVKTIDLTDYYFRHADS